LKWCKTATTTKATTTTKNNNNKQQQQTTTRTATNDDNRQGQHCNKQTISNTKHIMICTNKTTWAVSVAY
jgi:hypothetical protein